MRYPSIKTLSRLVDGDTEKAKEIRGILDGTVNPWDYSSVRELDAQSYNPQPEYRRKLTACDEALTGFGFYGIEWCEYPGDQDRMINRQPRRGFEYLNTGDSYTETLVYLNGAFYVRAWGNIVENWS